MGDGEQSRLTIAIPAAASVQCCLPPPLTLIQVDDALTRFTLTPRPPECGTGYTDEGCRVKWTLDKTDIAQDFRQSRRRWIAFWTTAAPRQNYERKIGPAWLFFNPERNGA